MLNKISLFTALGLILLAAGPASAGAEVEFLKGNVHYLDQTGSSLQQRMTAAEKEFASTKKSGFYFTGYIFSCRHTIHTGDTDRDVSFTVKKKSDRIKIRRHYKSSEEHGYSVHTEDEGGGPAGLVVLHELESGKSRILDSTLFDLDDTYEFSEVPIYWLGEADSQESFKLLKRVFESGEAGVQDGLLFVLSAHDVPEVGSFLKSTALGSYPRDVRKNAIFWLGNLDDRDSFQDLKEIYQKVDSTELKKQVVFALSLTEDEAALHEMIRIAREEGNREVRKNAIFWLGQKASKEATKALAEVVEGSDEDDDVKKSAVFALSQLPAEESVPILIKIAKTNKSPAVRKNAIFWLGQTDDEAALKFFEDILLKK